ncbi:secretin N-terminal domain-containing protein [Gemmatimonas sp.]|jgi:general secretion pathway protein D|uniref:secretin N-terminal domain-containing protein n=1 Tax=Gemmatimonas sp. TaxID=1962908 RepID=UPI0037BFCECE
MKFPSVTGLRARHLLAFGLLSVPTLLSAQARPAESARAASLDFSNARLADVIRALAQILGRTVILSDIPDVRVTFATPVAVTNADVERVLESLLEAHGLMLIPSGTVAQVLPTEKSPSSGALRTGFAFPDPAPLGLVTQLVPLLSIRADEGADALKAVAAKGARIETVTRSNALLITDRGSNMARYLELLRTLDSSPAGESGLRTYVVNLKYASAEDLAGAIGQLFGVQVANANIGSLADRSLTRALDSFRTRESDTFRTRNSGMPNTGAASTSANNTAAAVTPRDSAAGLLVGRTTVVANAPTNALVIRTAPPNFPMLRETIDALDVRPAQVLFEVTIAEIALGRGFEFGVDWGAVNRGGDVRGQFGNPEIPDTGSTSALLRLVRLDGTGVRALLRAIASTSKVQVLSTPEIVAVNNREATILVGNKVPFIASTRLGNDVSIDRAVQYQDVGTKLSILPTINDDGYVSVQLLQEVSSLTPQTVSAALSAPVISTREASTRAILRDGQTVVIAGLIGDTRQVQDQGIPLLKDIPFAGALFRRQSTTRQRTELAIFVTPYIVRSDADADTIRERIRKRMEEKSPGALDDTPVKRPPSH